MTISNILTSLVSISIGGKCDIVFAVNYVAPGLAAIRTKYFFERRIIYISVFETSFISSFHHLSNAKVMYHNVTSVIYLGH